ncbi:hypothetical protein B0H17DRAFT_1324943 [Mycena rosella]|uniref:Uncharacterized protein n=1 Tax=Mycena rosella TaxID=1033263 RepID=A0AAD7GZV1_MYCRO|nr:hypothetical protein B0H17DRAFT_1324943 [Mycena rosella]
MSSASSSTASLVSTTTVSSRAPLTKRAAPPKDFEAAFGSLQSTYGFAGATPIPVQKPATPRSASRSPATVAPRQTSTPGQPKDFQAAFASLQSTYGFAAAVPSPVSNPKSRSFISKFTRTSAKSPTSTPARN